MKFLKWLENRDKESAPDVALIEEVKSKKNITVLEQAILDVENTENIDTVIELNPIVIEEKKFIDKETGKSYKTERGMKAAITRRKNKLKKNKK